MLRIDSGQKASVTRTARPRGDVWRVVVRDAGDGVVCSHRGTSFEACALAHAAHLAAEAQEAAATELEQ